MEHEILLTLTILKVLTVALGGVFLWFTVRAYIKHRARGMLVLSLAVGLMTFAAVTEGAALQVFGASRDVAHALEAAITLAAFAVLVLSVITHRLD